MPIGDLGPELTVLIGAVAILILAMWLPRDRHGWCAGLTLAVLAVAAIWSAGQLGAARLTFMGTFALDGATGWTRLTILIATALVVLLSPRWFATDRRHGEYYAVLLFSALGAMLMAGAADLMQLVMSVLLSSITGYTLAAYHRDWELSVEAGMKYFLLGALANALMVLGAVLIMGMAGTTAYAELAGRAPEGPLWQIGLMLVVLGLLFKLGAVPAHGWLPDVAEGAPAPAAAFLTVVPKLAGGLALFRLVALVPDEGALRLLIALAAAATMTLGNLAALWQDDVRRLIGWSSVSQAGYALVAVAGAGRADMALTALLVFLAVYAAANIVALGVVSEWRGRTALSDYNGLMRRQPLMASALIVSFLSLVGIPPLAGFLGKFGLFLVALEAEMLWLALFLLANSVLSLAYYLRVVWAMVFSDPSDEVQTLGGIAPLAPLIATAALLVLGILGAAIWQDPAALPPMVMATQAEGGG